MDEKPRILESVTKSLLKGSKSEAFSIIVNNYPFRKLEISHRRYSLYEKMKVFIKDGFIDRYTGDKLVNPGILKILSNYFPNDFPYHPNWKMSETYAAYWGIFPINDHLIPIAQGGIDKESNWVTTSMFNNSKKSNWTLEQLGWKLHDAGDIKECDGLTNTFLQLVENDNQLLEDRYIKKWYNAIKRILKKQECINI